MTTHFRVGACLQFAKQWFLCDTVCLDVCIKQLIKKLQQLPCYNLKTHAVWRHHSVGNAPCLIRGHMDETDL